MAAKEFSQPLCCGEQVFMRTLKNGQDERTFLPEQTFELQLLQSGGNPMDFVKGRHKK